MIEQDEWVFFKDIEWNDPKFNVFSVDTRDFHCGYRWEEKPREDIKTLSKYPDRFFTDIDTVKLILNKLYDESGGKSDWRMLSFKCGLGNAWEFKYIRIWRQGDKFIICDRSNKAVNVEKLLKVEINEKYL